MRIFKTEHLLPYNLHYIISSSSLPLSKLITANLVWPLEPAIALTTRASYCFESETYSGFPPYCYGADFLYATLLLACYSTCMRQRLFAYLITSSFSCMVDPVYGVSLERTVPAVDLALEYINLHPDLFPAINLTYGSMVNSLEVPMLKKISSC